MARRIGSALAVVAAAFAGGFCAQIVWSPQPAGRLAAEPPPLPPLPTTTDSNPVPADRFEQIAARIAPVVVSVDAVKANLPGAAGKGKPLEESGSGVLMRVDGFQGTYVVTNHHVIAGAPSDQILLTLYDGRILRPKAVWTDAESDVSLLRVEGESLPVAGVGDSDRVRVGQWVLAFGSPFGLSQTVTHGIVSARERGQINMGNGVRIKDFIQTDAAINPGSSGGPLVDLSGSVVGINAAIMSNNGHHSGIAFSIPINLVKRICRELLEKGSVKRGYLGVQLAPVLEPAEALRLGLDRVRGALVETVHPGSPAATAGLKPGDVILRLESVDVRNENHLINMISHLPVSHRVRLAVWRDRQARTVEAVVADWAGTSAVSVR